MIAENSSKVPALTQDLPPSRNADVQFPRPTIRSPPLSSTSSSPHSSSIDSLSLSDPDIAQRVHPPTPDMAGTSHGHARRRSSLMDGVGGGKYRSSKERSRRQKQREQNGMEESNEHKYPPGDGHISASSSRSTSEDVELDDLISEDGADDEETGLTKEDKRKRRRRKRRRTHMNERIAGSVTVTKEEKTLADQSVLKRSLINALLIGLWYCFSLSISIYNTWMFSPKHLDFHFPLFTTCTHMLVQFSLASLVLYLFPYFRPRSDSISNPNQHTPEQHDSAKNTKPLMTRAYYLTRIGPCGAATGLDIGLGNMSLKFITLTFYTMCKSSSLAFVLLFAFLFGLESPSIKLILIIATMTVGVIMMVAGETAFNALGFILIISSAFFSGFRWGLTQILLLRNPATSNPFSSIFFLAPIMFLSLLLIALPVEGLSPLAAGLARLTETKGTVMGIGILLFPGILAFLMTSSEFALLQRTSVVTLSICGIFKEVVTISAAGIVFHDPLTPINVSGLLVTIASIAAYNYIKISKMRNDAREEVHHLSADEHAAREPMLAAAEADGQTRVQRSRRSTSELVHGAVRPSVSIPREVRLEGLVVESPVRASPVKRPEDLD